MSMKAIEDDGCHGEAEESSMDVVNMRTPKSTNTCTQRKRRKQEPKVLEIPEESPLGEPVNIPTTDTGMQDLEKSDAEMETIFEKNRRLNNQIITLQTFAQENKNKMKKMKRKLNQLEQLLGQHSMSKGESAKEESELEVATESEDEAMEEENEAHDPVYEVQADEEDTEEDEEEIEEASGLLQVDSNLRTEPKHIVFLSQLLLLFNFCHLCKVDNPLVETKAVGTEAVVTMTCNNPKCPQKTTVWHSQPVMPGRKKAPAGNFLLCMAVLLAGGSYTKVRQIFLHMGIGCVSHKTYFHYQRTALFPTIYIHWKKYQAMLMEMAKQVKDGVVLAGDGRHDSMGHSAKYCAYTIFCCTLGQIIHFNLVQRNQAGSSPAMEFMCFKLCMDYMITYRLTITTFISDRHTSIAKYMREVLKNIVHYFDIWHLKKKIRKVLSKIAKKKDCEAVSEWIKPCENHLHWSATTTFSGNGLVIWAKFKSFLRHMVNTHSHHSDPLFDKCAHGEIKPRKWLTVDSPLHIKVCTALTDTRLMEGIKKASPLEQTSCLEGFHSVLNHFAPKMIAYCYVGQYCRHILAVIHFNFNIQREVKTKADNSERVKISYPKFKNGEATVRSVRVAQNFAYIQEIYDTFTLASKNDLKDAAKKLKEMCPPPINTMLTKQTKKDALTKRSDRSQITIEDVPPTIPVEQYVEQLRREKEAGRTKAAPRCRSCGHPMKGHKNVEDCPKNK